MDEIAELLKGYTVTFGAAHVVFVCGHDWCGPPAEIPKECPVCKLTIDGECVDLERPRIGHAER